MRGWILIVLPDDVVNVDKVVEEALVFDECSCCLLSEGFVLILIRRGRLFDETRFWLSEFGCEEAICEVDDERDEVVVCKCFSSSAMKVDVVVGNDWVNKWLLSRKGGLMLVVEDDCDAELMIFSDEADSKLDEDDVNDADTVDVVEFIVVLVDDAVVDIDEAVLVRELMKIEESRSSCCGLTFCLSGATIWSLILAISALQKGHFDSTFVIKLKAHKAHKDECLHGYKVTDSEILKSSKQIPHLNIAVELEACALIEWDDCALLKEEE